MYTYLKNDIENTVITLPNELPTDAYIVGTSFDDYVNGKWVLLTQEQVDFYNTNPTASPKEILQMKLDPINIELLRQNKLNEIDLYDKSENVNSFKLNEQNVWVDRDTRVSLMSTTKIKQELGQEYTTIWFGDLNVTLPCENVIQMLSTLEMYAYDCFNQTAKHKAEVNKLTTEKEITDYDITQGYPEKLSFNL